MEIVDMIFEKIKNEKLRSINDGIFAYMIGQTDNYDEVQFIIDKLKYYKVGLGIKIYITALCFVERYDDAVKALDEIKKIKLRRKDKTKIKEYIYVMVINTATTLEQVEKIFNEVKDNYVKVPFGIYIKMIDKQYTYFNAKEMYKEYLLNEGWKGNTLEEWRLSSYYRLEKEVILPIFYLKVTNASETYKIKNELRIADMSLDKNDYNSSFRKLYKDAITETRKSLRKDKWIYEFLGLENNTQKLNINDNNTGNGIPSKTSRTIRVYSRNKSLVDDLKILYKNKCQICETVLDLGYKFYSEVYHIKPLHCNGEDVVNNMIVVCPNHHTLLDNGAIKLDLKLKKVINLNGDISDIKLFKHNISNEVVNYHNEIIFGKEQKSIYSITNDSTISFGSKVVLVKSNSREESLIQIEDEKEKFNMPFINFTLIGHKTGDVIEIDSCMYFINEVINDV